MGRRNCSTLITRSAPAQPPALAFHCGGWRGGGAGLASFSSSLQTDANGTFAQLQRNFLPSISVQSRPVGRGSGTAWLGLTGSSAPSVALESATFADTVKATENRPIHLTIGMREYLRSGGGVIALIACRSDVFREGPHTVR
jgi:hypothetical protein